MTGKKEIRFWLLLFIIIQIFASVGHTQNASDVTVDSELSSELSNDTEDAEEVSKEDYEKRVHYEVIASAVILLTFFFFVALISMVRFKRSVKHLAKIDQDRKFKYKDIWGNPRVHQDDLPTDKEMQGIDTLDDDDYY